MIPDLPHLRTLAEKATPGPWQHGNGIVYDTPEDDLHRFDILPISVATAQEKDEDAEFIAAANPVTVLALLDLIDSLRRGQDRR